MSASAPPAGGESRPAVETSAEQRQVGGERADRGERGERRGRRRGRRGRHGGGGASREGGTRDVASSGGASEGGTVETSVSAPVNGSHEHHHETAEARESFARPEAREPREAHESREPREAREPREPREASPRHEEPAPAAHFEPSPPTESNTPRETKPYVVWSSTPPDRAASGGNRGPEE